MVLEESDVDLARIEERSQSISRGSDTGGCHQYRRAVESKEPIATSVDQKTQDVGLFWPARKSIRTFRPVIRASCAQLSRRTGRQTLTWSHVVPAQVEKDARD